MTHPGGGRILGERRWESRQKGVTRCMHGTCVQVTSHMAACRLERMGDFKFYLREEPSLYGQGICKFFFESESYFWEHGAGRKNQGLTSTIKF